MTDLKAFSDSLTFFCDHRRVKVSHSSVEIPQTWLIQWYIASHTLNRVIKALVLSHHEHCLVICWCSAMNDWKQLKTPLAQNKDTRLAHHCSMCTNIPQRERILSWLPIENRWNASLLIFLRDVFNNRTQQYFINQDKSGLGYLLPPRF